PGEWFGAGMLSKRLPRLHRSSGEEECERHAPLLQEGECLLVQGSVPVVEGEDDGIGSFGSLQRDHVGVVRQPFDMAPECVGGDFHLQVRPSPYLVVDQDAGAGEVGQEAVTDREHRLGDLPKDPAHPAGSSADNSRSVSTGTLRMPKRWRGARLDVMPWSQRGCHPIGCSLSSSDGYQILDSGRLPSSSQAMASPSWRASSICSSSLATAASSPTTSLRRRRRAKRSIARITTESTKASIRWRSKRSAATNAEIVPRRLVMCHTLGSQFSCSACSWK